MMGLYTSNRIIQRKIIQNGPGRARKSPTHLKAALFSVATHFCDSSNPA